MIKIEPKKIKILVTGANGFVGSAIVRDLDQRGFNVFGVKRLGVVANPRGHVQFLQISDINGKTDWSNLLKGIDVIIHCAAQPSHDWAKNDPILDFEINATATVNLLITFKKFCPEASFIYVSTNKVYGDNPNKLKIVEKNTRFEINTKSKYYNNGIDETMSIDNCIHSLFGASKLSADLYVQEFGKNFNLNTVCFRGGCLTGENHSGVELHGFLSYIVKTFLLNKPYTIFGYKGKQVRDNIYSKDLINCFWEYIKNPMPGEVFNIGGGRKNSCSIIEIIEILKNTYNSSSKLYVDNTNRVGDHIWWITDFSKFKKFYPNWKINYSLENIIHKIAKKEIEKNQ